MKKFPNINPTKTNSWEKLSKHFEEIRSKSIKKLFEEKQHRQIDFSLEWKEFYFDFSKNNLTKETVQLLCELAKQCGLKQAIEQMFSGEKINLTEERAVFHTGLRNFSEKELLVGDQNVQPKIEKELSKIELFTDKILNGELKGATGKKFKSLVNIGIGGSDLGPAMVVEALKPYKTDLEVYFVSNLDGADISETLKKIDPETTLFLIASKTFTTQETMTNAEFAKKWMIHNLGLEEVVSNHFVALSTNYEKVTEFGIQKDRIFEFWDWVGGRFSLWSSIGLSISLAVGFDNFKKLLIGANKTDEHFRTSSFDENIPVLMGLIGIWYNNFYKTSSEAVIPYSENLKLFPDYLQQLLMESNGKAVNRKGEKVNYQTSSIVWGAAGTNGQHAFFQLLHQGTSITPVDFIVFSESNYESKDHHLKLISNCFAQSQALAFGKNKEEVLKELKNQKLSDEKIEFLKNHKIFDGNRPSNTLLIKKLTPENLGSLVALYEHKVFVQGVIWNIFSFDQWGVELGKQLSKNILSEIDKNEKTTNFDTSTNRLINKCLNWSD